MRLPDNFQNNPYLTNCAHTQLFIESGGSMMRVQPPHVSTLGRNHNDNIVRHYLIITPTNLTIRLNICTVSWSLWPPATGPHTATHNIWTQSHDEIAILKISLQSELLQLGPINIDHCAPATICNLHISIVAGIVSSTAITTYKCDHVCNLPSQATLLVDYFLSKTSYRSWCYVENLVLNVRLK